MEDQILLLIQENKRLQQVIQAQEGKVNALAQDCQEKLTAMKAQEERTEAIKVNIQNLIGVNE